MNSFELIWQIKEKYYLFLLNWILQIIGSAQLILSLFFIHRFGEKDRRPIDPPPVVQLITKDKDGNDYVE